jgi:4-hydroxybenzoyl-CoA thioesterase/acyl-CoA thioester hydrolase
MMYRTLRRVEFRDTDAAGLMHFSAFFTYMEEAEHEFLRFAGLSVLSQDDEGVLTWPRVAARCEYTAAVKFEDVLDIEVGIQRLGNKSVTYGFTFRLDNRPVATGEVTSVCCRFDAEGRPRSVEIPAWFAEKIGERPGKPAQKAAAKRSASPASRAAKKSRR